MKKDAARYFEDFSIGERWKSLPLPLTADEITEFAKVNDPQPIHTDSAYASGGPFGSLIASGWQIAALSMRRFVEAGGYGQTPVVGLGIDELRWLKPVRPGDQLSVEREIVAVRRSKSNPKFGVLRTKVVMKNQREEVVMSLFAIGRVPARCDMDQ